MGHLVKGTVNPNLASGRGPVRRSGGVGYGPFVTSHGKYKFLVVRFLNPITTIITIMMIFQVILSATIGGGLWMGRRRFITIL